MKTKYLLVSYFCLVFSESVNSIYRDFYFIDSNDVIRGNIKNIKNAIDKGANVNIDFGGGMTPLIIAAIQSNMSLIKLLLDAGAHPNTQDDSKETALMKSIRQESDPNGNILELLLDYNADPYIKNSEHKTALDIANELNSPKKDILEGLIKKSEEKRKKIRLATQKEVAENSPLFSDLAEIVSAYSV